MNFSTRSTCFLLFVFSCSVSAGILGRIFHNDPEWNSLRVTWGVNIVSDHVFTKMPLRTNKAVDKGYEMEQAGASCSGKFLGTRYVKPSNPGIVLLYDHNGFFAGIQIYVPKNNSSPVFYQKSPLFIEGQVKSNTSYILTAYFVEPDIICTTGRTKQDYDKQKVGNALYIQNGPNPLRDHLKVPLYENETTSDLWFKGSCYTSMGIHYWHNISKEMSCDNLMPLFLVFNHGKLTGFGWAIQDKVTSSAQFEHPDKDNLKKYFDSTPRCVKDLYTRGSGLTLIHIYMNSKPWNLLC